MKFQYSDGGRSNYFTGITGDCVTRSFTNALDKDYLEVYRLVNQICENQKKESEIIRGLSLGYTIEDGNARDGVYPRTIRMIAKHFNLKFKRKNGKTKNLKKGKYIVLQYGHLTCVKDGILLDTHDCSCDKHIGYFKV
jgi:hypothetical protein